MYIKNCPICNTKFDLDETDDVCPHCGWLVQGWENEIEENDPETCNPLTVRQAKDNLAKGLDIWGNPIKK